MRSVLSAALLVSLTIGQGFVPADETPGPGIGSAMVTDPATGRALLFDPMSTWLLVHGRWRPVTTANHPGRIGEVVLAGDRGNNTTVLFGMRGNQLAAETWVFGGADWLQLTPAVSPPRRTRPLLAYHPGTRRVVLHGGRVEVVPGSGFFTPSNDTWTWDGRTWRQESGAAPPARSFAAMATDEPRDRIVLFGGSAASGPQQPLADTWEWDGRNWIRVIPPTSPPARAAAFAAFDPVQKRVIVHGGTAGGPLLLDTWSWSGTNWRLEEAAATHGGLAEMRGAIDPSTGRLLMRATSQALNPALATQTWQWDGTAWSEWLAPSLPMQGLLIAAAHDAVGEGVVRLGSNLFDAAAQYRFDGRHWSTVQPATPLRQYVGGTQSSVLVHDPLRGEVLLYSEFGLATPETWRWNGATWTQAAGAMPPTRLGHAMAFDAARGEVVLFGGAWGTAYFDDTWIWNGSSWTQQQPAVRPPARKLAAMSFVPVAGQLAMFGGFRGLAAVGDTWLWDGTNWQAFAGPGPAPRSAASMCWWPRNGTALLSGGDEPGADEIWQFDGAQWQLLGHRPHADHVALIPVATRNAVWFVSPYDVWVFADVVGDTATVGDGCAASARSPRLDAGNRPMVGSDVVLALELALPAAPALLFASPLLQPQPLQSCTVQLGAAQLWRAGTTDAHGATDWTLSIPAQAALLGLAMHFQAAVADDPGAVFGMALTNALRVTVGN